MIIVNVPLTAIIVERPQEVPEDPVGYLSALLPRRFVRETEVDALVNTSVDYLLGRIREAGDMCACPDRSGPC